MFALNRLFTAPAPVAPGGQNVGELIRNEKGLSSSLKVIVGGAPLSNDFCKEIGADAYGVDAMDAVVKVKELMGL